MFNPKDNKSHESPIKLDAPSISQEILYTTVILLCFVIGFFLWAALAPLESVAIAPGFITAVSSNKMIQHTQGGNIKEVYVKESQNVKSGQPLILLDDPQLEAKAEAFEKSKIFFEAKRARLTAQLNNKKEITFPSAVTKESDKPEIAMIIETEKNLFEKTSQAFFAELEVLNQQRKQLEQQQQQAKANFIAMKAQKEYIKQELDAVQYLLEKQLARKPRLLSLQRESSRLDGEMTKSLAEGTKIEHQQEEVNSKIAALKKEFHRKNLNDLEETEQRLLEIEPQHLSAKIQKERLVIKANADGIVKGLRYKTPGEVIKSGDIIMEIVPVGDPMVVEVQVDPKDVNEVHPGLRAKITVTAFSFRDTPNFFGVVQYVSPDAFVNEKDNRRYYTVRISDFDEEWKKIEDRLTPGMPVEVSIINEKRTVLYYIFSPLFKSFEKAFHEP